MDEIRVTVEMILNFLEEKKPTTAEALGVLLSAFGVIAAMNDISDDRIKKMLQDFLIFYTETPKMADWLKGKN